MRPLRFLLFALALTAVSPALLPILSPALAVQPDEVLADPVLEARARALSKELRCMVCQNQSIDDSDAPLARDLRILVRERIEAGDTDQRVIDFLVVRYGEFVLLKPRFSRHTALLWLGPATIVLIGALALGVAARRTRGRAFGPGSGQPQKLTPGEESRLAEILRRGDG
jgi:cytochrome c-type biogenesis protein CcmH